MKSAYQRTGGVRVATKDDVIAVLPEDKSTASITTNGAPDVRPNRQRRDSIFYFDPDLDMRGRTVRLRGSKDERDPIVAIPQKAERWHRLNYVIYVWRPEGQEDGAKRWARQCVYGGALPSTWDIVEVLSVERTSTNTTANGAPAAESSRQRSDGMTTFDPDLDLRGYTVRLRGDGDGTGRVLLIPPGVMREKATHFIRYSGLPLHSRPTVVYQNTDALAPQTEYDIVALLIVPKRPDSSPTPSYHFRARRFQDIALARIAREIGTAPYALVEWDDQSLVIAGEQAQRRGEAVSHDPTKSYGWCGLSIDVAGRLSLHGDLNSITGWFGPDAQAQAAEWWAEVRRRERPDVIVTVFPAP